MTGPNTLVRAWRDEDAPELVDLMRRLAVFEGYDDEFRVDEDALIRHGRGPKPAFSAWVAERPGLDALAGMAVTYVQPWTYDLRPALVLKELFVAERTRGTGTGTALMRAVIGEGEALGASRIVWTVLHGNVAAERFYERVGGMPDTRWNAWTFPLPSSTR